MNGDYRYCSFDRQRSHVAHGLFVFLSNRDTQHNNQFALFTLHTAHNNSRGCWDHTDVMYY